MAFRWELARCHVCVCVCVRERERERERGREKERVRETQKPEMGNKPHTGALKGIDEQSLQL